MVDLCAAEIRETKNKQYYVVKAPVVGAFHLFLDPYSVHTDPASEGGKAS